jgi:pimeloyl-ACP methyl ester carboxylesterase
MPTLAHTDAGTGGIPLVLLHGFPLDSRMWDEQVGELSKVARVIAPDFRGFGKSESTQEFTMESLADDVHELLASIGALPCVLAGLSMGGYVALAYVKKYPTDVAALVLFDTKAEPDNAEGKTARNQMIDTARAKGSKPIADKMQPRLLDPRTEQRAPAVVKRVRQMMESCPPQTIARALAAMRDRLDHTATLAAIRVPALIAVGESDAITPPDVARKMHQKIAGSRLEIIPDSGHMSPMEQPERVNEVLLSFIKQVAPAPA